MKLPLIQNGQNLKQYDNTEILLEGKYELLNVSQRSDRVVYNGRVQIILLDGFSVCLERNKAGIRSESEINNFKGKKVRVKGILLNNVQIWGNGLEACLAMPCITEIKSIEFS